MSIPHITNKMMKNSKDQLERLLKGYPYYVYVKELRSDDPANRSPHTTFENKMQKKNGAYANYNQDNSYRYTKRSSIAGKTRKTHRTPEDASMYVIKFASNETRLDIDEISFFITSRGVSANLFRIINGIKEPESCIIPAMGVDFIHHPQLGRIERALNRKIRDTLVWSDFRAGFDSRLVNDVVLDYDYISDEEKDFILGISTNKIGDTSEFPDLSKLNKVLDGLEKIVRDDLG